MFHVSTIWSTTAASIVRLRAGRGCPGTRAGGSGIPGPGRFSVDGHSIVCRIDVLAMLAAAVQQVATVQFVQSVPNVLNSFTRFRFVHPVHQHPPPAE